MAVTSRTIAERPASGGVVLGTLDERVRMLERQGYRVTPQRKSILTGILNAGTMNVSAEEICRRARGLCPTVNLATTYRTLDLLGRLGMVRQIPLGGGRSVYCPNLHPHYHGTCLRCGAVVDLPLGSTEKSLERDVAALTGGMFDIVGHRIEFYGYCASCHEEAPARAAGP